MPGYDACDITTCGIPLTCALRQRASSTVMASCARQREPSPGRSAPSLALSRWVVSRRGLFRESAHSDGRNGAVYTLTHARAVPGSWKRIPSGARCAGRWGRALCILQVTKCLSTAYGGPRRDRRRHAAWMRRSACADVRPTLPGEMPDFLYDEFVHAGLAGEGPRRGVSCVLFRVKICSCARVHVERVVKPRMSMHLDAAGDLNPCGAF